MPEHEDPGIDGDIVNGTFSTRAPKVEMSAMRLLSRDPSLGLLLKLMLFLLVVGVLLFALWSKIVGGLLIGLALLLVGFGHRYLGLRRTEFRHAVLTPGVVVAEKPPTVLVLANLATGGGDPVWGVRIEECRSFAPLDSRVGTRIPCVSAFLGDGVGGSWDQMVCQPLSSATGDPQVLGAALARLDDEEEWRVLEQAVAQQRIPGIGRTLRLAERPGPPPMPRA